MKSRACARCGVEKPMTEFPVSYSKRSGFSGVCKACTASESAVDDRYSAGAKHSMCTRKRRYPSKSFALSVATRAARRTTMMRVYQCPICKGWHLTHKPPREKE